LRPENSFVRCAGEQGNTVFLISWRNISPELGHMSWDDYLRDGAMKAVEVALEVSGADKVDAVG
jgi:polyhydroxyalkanoate synthase